MEETNEVLEEKDSKQINPVWGILIIIIVAAIFGGLIWWKQLGGLLTQKTTETVPTTNKNANENGAKKSSEKTFEDDESGKFQFNFPGTWYVSLLETDGFPASVLTVFRPREELTNGTSTVTLENGIEEMVNVKGIDYTTTLGPSAIAENAYEDANPDEGKFRGTGDEISEITLAGETALKKISEGMGGAEYVTIIILKEKFYYQIDYQTPASDDTEAKEGIDTILNSFEIL